MRKILSEEELAARQSKRNRWISLILLIIMVFGTAGAAFIYNSESNNNSNTGGKVQQYGSYWQASFGGTTLSFSSSPESSLNNTKIGIIPSFDQFYQQPLYIASNDTVVKSEIARTLGLFSLRMSDACYFNCENSEFVQKDCTNNVIIFTQSNNRSITQNQSCIFINGDLATVDGFLYKTFGLA